MAPAGSRSFFERFVQGGLREVLGITDEGIGKEINIDLTIPAVMEALQKAIASSNDPKEAVQLAMLLTCILAHQNGWNGLELAGQAQAMWKHTEGLHRDRKGG